MNHDILSQIDSYTPTPDLSDLSYIPPRLRCFLPDRRLLRNLRAMRVSYVSGPSLSEKIETVAGGRASLDMRDSLMRQADWPGFMSFIWRDVPDARGKTITFLPNDDTLAVILAVRLGIEAEVAVALVHQDLIHAAQLDIDHASVPAHHDDVLLGIIMAPGSCPEFRYALFARKKAETFVTPFRKEELILLHQTKDVGLFRGLGSYNSDLLKPLRCRTDQPVWAHCAGVELSQ